MPLCSPGKPTAGKNVFSCLQHRSKLLILVIIILNNFPGKWTVRNNYSKLLRKMILYKSCYQSMFLGKHSVIKWMGSDLGPILQLGGSAQFEEIKQKWT